MSDASEAYSRHHAGQSVLFLVLGSGRIALFNQDFQFVRAVDNLSEVLDFALAARDNAPIERPAKPVYPPKKSRPGTLSLSDLGL